MLATERLLQIQAALGAQVERIAVVELDEETLRLVLYLKDSTNLRVAEEALRLTDLVLRRVQEKMGA